MAIFCLASKKLMEGPNVLDTNIILGRKLSLGVKMRRIFLGLHRKANF
jgi:hypothetical protein